MLLKNQIKYTQSFPKWLWSISNIRTIMRLHTKYVLWPSKIFRGRKDYRAISFCSLNLNSTYLAKNTNHEKPLGLQFISIWCVSLKRSMQNVSWCGLIVKNVYSSQRWVFWMTGANKRIKDQWIRVKTAKCQFFWNVIFLLLKY